MPAIRDEVAAEGEAEVNEEEVVGRTLARVFEEPIAEDIAVLECADYTEAEIQHDTESVDWESAFEEVGEMER